MDAVQYPLPETVVEVFIVVEVAPGIVVGVCPQYASNFDEYVGLLT